MILRITVIGPSPKPVELVLALRDWCVASQIEASFYTRGARITVSSVRLPETMTFGQFFDGVREIMQQRRGEYVLERRKAPPERLEVI
jgi:hypothetical protein